MQGNSNEALINYYYALNAYDGAGEVKDIVRLLLNAGGIYESHNHLEKALENYKEAYDMMNSDPKMSLTILHNIGRTYSKSLLYHESLSYFQTGLDLATQLQDTLKQAQFENNIGVLHQDLGNLKKAEEHGLNALNLYRQVGAEKAQSIL